MNPKSLMIRINKLKEQKYWRKILFRPLRKKLKRKQKKNNSNQTHNKNIKKSSMWEITKILNMHKRLMLKILKNNLIKQNFSLRKNINNIPHNDLLKLTRNKWKDTKDNIINNLIKSLTLWQMFKKKLIVENKIF